MFWLKNSNLGSVFMNVVFHTLIEKEGFFLVFVLLADIETGFVSATSSKMVFFL